MTDAEFSPDIYTRWRAHTIRIHIINNTSPRQSMRDRAKFGGGWKDGQNTSVFS
jgi:hypothetical protein